MDLAAPPLRRGSCLSQNGCSVASFSQRLGVMNYILVRITFSSLENASKIEKIQMLPFLLSIPESSFQQWGLWSEDLEGGFSDHVALSLCKTAS
jgi:hypothetical protein